MVDIEARVVVTGAAWMGSGIGSIESAIDDLFGSAEHEILMTAYSIGDGTDLIIHWLESALGRGIEVTVVVHEFDSQPESVQSSLRDFARNYDHFSLLDFHTEQYSALHAKAIVADRKIAIVGSSNMSKRGLLGNFELAVEVRGNAAVATGQAIDALVVSQFVSPVRH